MSRYSVRVKPKSSRTGVTVLPDDTIEVRVHSAPEDGKANQELIEILAGHFHVPRRSVVILKGETSRNKIVEVQEGK